MANAKRSRRKEDAPQIPKTTLPAVIGKGTSVGNLVDLKARSGAYAWKSLSARTQREYERCWQKWADWCAAHGKQPLPAYIADAALYVTWLASEQGYANSSIGQATSAIKSWHKFKRAKPLDAEGNPTDWEDGAFSLVMQGVRREVSQRPLRQAKALTDEDLRMILEMTRPGLVRDGLEAAIMVVAYAGCRRRSEVVGLDYKERANDDRATGILDVTAEGISISLYRSKTHQEGGDDEVYFIRRRDVPRGCKAIEEWLALAKIKPGTPIFRPVFGLGTSPSNHQGLYYDASLKKPWRARAGWRKYREGRHLGYFKTEAEALNAQKAAAAADGTSLVAHCIGEKRVHPEVVNNVMKRQMRKVLIARKLAETKRKRLLPEEIEAIKREAAGYSGHSGRVGSITSAGERGLRTPEIMRMSGHKTAAMVIKYTRVAEVKKNDFMRGSGL